MRALIAALLAVGAMAAPALAAESLSLRQATAMTDAQLSRWVGGAMLEGATVERNGDRPLAEDDVLGSLLFRLPPRPTGQPGVCRMMTVDVQFAPAEQVRVPYADAKASVDDMFVQTLYGFSGPPREPSWPSDPEKIKALDRGCYSLAPEAFFFSDDESVAFDGYLWRQRMFVWLDGLVDTSPITCRSEGERDQCVQILKSLATEPYRGAETCETERAWSEPVQCVELYGDRRIRIIGDRMLHQIVAVEVFSNSRFIQIN